MPELLLLAGLLALGALTRLGFGRLPVAPRCPGCRSVTDAVRPRGFVARALTASIATSLRSCGRCGWEGLMRWRWATQRAHRSSGDRPRPR